MKIEESLFLKALHGKNQTGKVPVWLMRQAGRYMPSYQKLKEKYSLMEMFTKQQLITHITKLAVEELDVDAAIIFSDILLPLQALGYEVEYEQGQGPNVHPKKPLFSDKALFSQQALEEQFSFLTQSIAELKRELKIPLIGFCGAPFTLASYVLEKKAHHLMKETKALLYQDPELFFQFLDLLSDLVISFAKMQVKAGAEVIQIFDSWSGVLDEEAFRSCSFTYLKKIVSALKQEQIPVIIFCRGACLFVDTLIKAQPSAISFDWHLPMQNMAKKVPSSIAVQGNLDPDILKGSFDLIRKKTLNLLQAMRSEPRFIMNLGHGVLPEIPYDNVKYFVKTVKEFSYQ